MSLFSLHLFEDDVGLGSICQILLSFFDMSNVVYGSVAIKALFIVNTLFSDLLNLISLCSQ